MLDIRVSDSVDPYSFHSAGGTAAAHLVVEVRFHSRKYTVIFIELQRLQISLHLICIEVWHKDTANAPIFKAYELSTAVLEFIASAILIPVVLDCINSFKDKQATKDSNPK